MLGVVFFLENSPVGMTLFKRPPLSPSWASRSAATIHGLKIAKPWQGRGLGHQSFKLAVHHLRKEWPAITKLTLAVDADNTAALSVYRAYGMIESRAVFEGINGPEYRLEISLV